MCRRATSGGLLALVAAAMLALGCSDSVTSEHRAHLGPAFALDAVPVAGHTLYVPSGFAVNLFAEGLDGARALALGPGGAVFVTLSTDGEIVRLVDADGDGIANTRSTVLSGLSYPFGLAFRGDTMYFAEQTAVQRLDPGATTPVMLIPNLPVGGHVTRTIAFGPDNLLYVAIGSSCNVCDDAAPRAAVTRYNLDGSNPHTFATGLRNSVGLAFHPTTGELWANNNDRDGLGDELPPEHLNILRDGRWYGWPQCYLPGEANPEYPNADCSDVEPPAFTFQAHSAPLGLAFYTGATFPAEYQGDAFMTYHGSWNRDVPTGAKVVRVAVQNGRPAAIDDFVTGWQLADGSRWGRPVGLLVMPDGALLVSDDLGGRIWRVSFGQGPPVDPTGDLDVTTATTGSDPDPDGYTVTVDGTANQAIESNGSVTFSGVAAGSHTVALSGVASNCSVDGGNAQSGTVPSGGRATTSFTITCDATTGDLVVTTSTSGSSLDANGYTVRLDGGSARALGINDTFTYTNLAAGNHTVVISGVAANCTVSGGRSRTVSVPSGGTATVAYAVSCATPPGDLTVTTSTSGSSQPSGYTVTVDESQTRAIGANGTVTFSSLAAGSHSVALTNVATNCTVSSVNPQTVTVPSGGTVTASFSASCTTPNRPPVVNAGVGQAVLLGAMYALPDASFSDPDNDGPWSYTIFWGDGSSSTGTKSSQGSLTGAHNYLLPGTYRITVMVTDAHRATGSDAKNLTVGSLPGLN
jgi:glucose/arabinose dehydrogenase